MPTLRLQPASHLFQTRSAFHHITLCSSSRFAELAQEQQETDGVKATKAQLDAEYAALQRQVESLQEALRDAKQDLGRRDSGGHMCIHSSHCQTGTKPYHVDASHLGPESYTHDS